MDDAPLQAEAEGRRRGAARAWDRLLNALNAADAAGHVAYAALLARQLLASCAPPPAGPPLLAAPALALAAVAAG